MEQQKYVSSIFKKEILTGEEYTRVWTELISAMERGKDIITFEKHTEYRSECNAVCGEEKQVLADTEIRT